jgi:hypothetical protein
MCGGALGDWVECFYCWQLACRAVAISVWHVRRLFAEAGLLQGLLCWLHLLYGTVV